MARRSDSTLLSKVVHSWVVFLLVFAGLAIAQIPVPQIAQPLVPASARPGSSGFFLTVNGAGFMPQSVVRWNGKARLTKFVSSTQVRARIFKSDLASATTASVTVTSPGPGGGSSNVDFFEVTVPRVLVAFTSSTLSGNELMQRQAAADLNGDGKLDLMGTVSLQNAISVRLGNGDGTFQAEVDYPTATGPGNLVVRDFNGDGRPDIAVVCSGMVSLLLGNGDGTFQTHIDSPVDSGLVTFGIDAGDFNGDGKLDLVVGYQDPSSNSVSVLLGNGDGTFQPPVDYGTGNEPGAVAVADLNHDGKLDIVAANFGVFAGTSVSVLLGNGDGTFQPQAPYATSQGPLSVVVADFNGDGNPDLAVDCSCGYATRCGYPGQISILTGLGDGTFASHVDYAASSFPYTVDTGDFNGDGILDLMVTDLDRSEVSLLGGKEDGTFYPAAIVARTGGSPVGIAPGDFNGNGKLDAAIGTEFGVTLLLH